MRGNKQTIKKVVEVPEGKKIKTNKQIKIFPSSLAPSAVCVVFFFSSRFTEKKFPTHKNVPKTKKQKQNTTQFSSVR